MKRIARLGLIGAVALASAPAFARPGGSFVGMGDLPGGVYYSYALSVSADGSVVGGASDMGLFPDGYQPTAAKWTRALGTRPLPGLIASNLRSSAQAVSGDGRVIGGNSSENQDYRAFLWKEHGGKIELPVPTEAPSGAWLSALSFDGSVAVGTVEMTAAGYNNSAIRWVDGVGQFLTGLDEPGEFSQARGISQDGRIVVGTVVTKDGRFEPFRWTEGSGVERLGVLPGYHSHWVLAASADASVIAGVGYYYDESRGSYNLPFAWSEEEGLRALETLPELTWGQAEGVSGDGSVLVGSSGVGAVVWLGVNPPLRLSDYLGQLGITGFEEWQLWNASAISTDGRTIVGSGTNPSGNNEGFIATIPPHCPGDADHDGAVSFADISVILTNWHGFGPQGDANDDFIVDFNDITETLTNWQGECP